MSLLESHQDWPKQYWDPSEHEGPRVGRPRLGRFTTEKNRTYVYERYNVVCMNGQKVFLVIPLGGVEGKLLDSGNKDTPAQWEPSDFDHERFQAIIRSPSLRDWWASANRPEDARWLYTTSEGKLVSVSRWLFTDSQEEPQPETEPFG